MKGRSKDTAEKSSEGNKKIIARLVTYQIHKITLFLVIALSILIVHDFTLD